MTHRSFSPGSCCLSQAQVLLVLVISLGLATAAFAADNPTPCSGNSEIRQLDYWLGNWTITHSGETGSGTSKVYLSLDKCLFVESWDNSKGHAGKICSPTVQMTEAGMVSSPTIRVMPTSFSAERLLLVSPYSTDRAAARRARQFSTASGSSA